MIHDLRHILSLALGHEHPDARPVAGLAALAPHVRGGLNALTLTRRRLVALTIVFAAAVFNIGLQHVQAGGGAVLGFKGLDAVSLFVIGLSFIGPIFATAYITGALWEGVFAHLRKRRRDPGLIVTALAFTALMPPAASLWHVVLAMSFAIVFAQEVFGGQGKTFVPPALVGASVLQVSFPSYLAGDPVWSMVSGYGGTQAFSLFATQGPEGWLAAGVDVWGAALGNVQGMIGAAPLWVMLAAVVLIVSGAANWRPMTGVALGVMGVSALTDFGFGWATHIAVGGLAFAAVFVATDPAGSASTNGGRWMQGILAGALVVLIRAFNPGHIEGVVPAFLFAAISAPLLDWIGGKVQVRRAKLAALRRRARL